MVTKIKHAWVDVFEGDYHMIKLLEKLAVLILLIVAVDSFIRGQWQFALMIIFVAILFVTTILPEGVGTENE